MVRPLTGVLSAALAVAAFAGLPTLDSAFAASDAEFTQQEPADALAELDLAKERAALKKLAESLAKSGRTRAVAAVQEEFRRFGASEKEFSQLREKTTKALLKAKPARNAKAAQKQVDKDLVAVGKCANVLVARGETLEGAQAEAIYRAAVGLDGSNAAARQGLGHTQDADGEWRSERERAMWTFNSGFEEAIAEARATSYPVETLDVLDTLLTEVATGPVSAVGFGPVRLEGEMTAAALEHRLQQVLRGSALANWFCSGKLEPSLGEFSIVIQPTGGPWTRYLDGALEHEWLDETERADSVAVTGSWIIPYHRGGDFRSWYVATTSESVVETVFKVDRSLLGDASSREDWDKMWKNRSASAPYWLSAGLTNLVGIAVLDSTWNNIPFEVGSPPDGSAMDAAGNELSDRRYMMLLPVARAWMAEEVAMGRALDMTEVMRTEAGGMTSCRLLQLTFMVEFLAARDGLDTVLARFRKAAGGNAARGPGIQLAAMAPLLGQPVEDFAAEWEAWMLAGGAEQTVRGLLVSQPAATTDDGERYTWLEAINNARLRAGAPEAALDKALSAGCEAYAQALSDGAEVAPGAAAWAEAHGIGVERAGKPAAQIDEWMGTVHLRMQIMRPTTEGIGIGLAGRALAVDASSASYRSGLWHAHWPPHESREIPAEHADVGPASVAGESNAAMGYPATMLLGSAHGEPEVLMTMTGPDGLVDCWYSTPLAPLNPEQVPAGVYALIPKVPLTGGRQYSVSAKWGEYELSWDFITD